MNRVKKKDINDLEDFMRAVIAFSKGEHSPHLHVYKITKDGKRKEIIGGLRLIDP